MPIMVYLLYAYLSGKESIMVYHLLCKFGMTPLSPKYGNTPEYGNISKVFNTDIYKI